MEPDRAKTVVQVLDFEPNSRRSMEVFLCGLAKSLRSDGWRSVHVITGSPGDYFRSEMAALDCPILSITFPLTLRGAVSLGKRLRRFRPDVLHTTFLPKLDPAMWLLKWFSNARTLIAADHTSGVMSQKRAVGRIAARARGRVADAFVDKVIAVSEFVRQRNISGAFISPEKVRTIYNGIEIERFSAVARESYDRFTIAYAGQLIPEKGVLTLLRAYRGMRDAELGPMRLLIAGRGPQEPELRQFCEIEGLNDVVFLGQIDWVPKLFRSADIVVIPSQWGEAFGFVVAEAMACGACILASEAGAIPEVVGSDGSCGVLFRTGDHHHLRERLVELMNDPHRRDELGQAARRRAADLFKVERMVREYTEVYREIGLQAG